MGRRQPRGGRPHARDRARHRGHDPGSPADYPQYNNGRGYYAVFFSDPDGLKLECVYTPPLR